MGCFMLSVRFFPSTFSFSSIFTHRPPPIFYRFSLSFLFIAIPAILLPFHSFILSPTHPSPNSHFYIYHSSPHNTDLAFQTQATNPPRPSSAPSSKPTLRATSSPCPARRRRPSRACSPRETCRISGTGRLSRLPGAAVWPRWRWRS
jgi:hypothetical protein